MKTLTEAQLDRACGVLLGAAVGDALGAGYEFEAVDSKLEPEMIGGGLGDFAPGEWTDDTSMTWCVAAVAATGADLRSREGLTSIVRGFRSWFETSPPDIGGTTSSALALAGKNPTATNAIRGAREICGMTNGSLMRTSPVALAHLDDPSALVEAAMRVSELTHAGLRAQESCALWSLAIRHAVLFAEFNVRAGLKYLPGSSRSFWAKTIDAAEQLEPGVFKPNGRAIVAFQAAWSSIVHTPVPGQFPCEHLEDSLTTAIRIGHDTDTVASICGALLGARWGMSAIPAEWRRILHGYPGKTGADLEELAILTVQGGEPGKYGWPGTEHIDYSYLQFEPGGSFAAHPHDPGVYLSAATHLDKLPEEVDAVISLCRVGSCQVPEKLEHINFRLLDDADPAKNPNLEFILVDAAELIQQLRAEGKIVLLHCVAAHSRTPTVAVAYSMLNGVDLNDAMFDVMEALPTCKPNLGFRRALRELEAGYFA